MPTDQTRTLHRIRLRKGEGDPVIMIHGFGADLNSWRMLAAGAALGRPILAIDLPGHGGSPVEGATDFQALVDAVAGVLREEGVTAADLIGHSLGAAVAVAVAAAADWRVRSLFLLAPAGLGPAIDRGFLDTFTASRDAETLAPAMARLVADPATLHPAFIQVAAELRARPGIAEAQARIAAAVFPDGRQAISTRETLTRLTAPICVVFGADDRIIPATDLRGLPDRVATHVLPGIGHLPQVEARDAVAALLVTHLCTAAERTDATV